jgi:DtxR family Mn-dependent transcriptional regulator
MTTSRLTRSREDYLKALFALEGGTRAVQVTPLAKRLHVTAPSATNMLARLAREGLVTRAARGEARLTALGLRRALQTLRRHRVLETYLVQALGLDWAAAHDEAEVLEHAVSDAVLDAMDRQLGRPHEDPHGHPIPDRRGRMVQRALVTLTALPAGAVAVVREVGDGDRAFMARCRRAGLVPGAHVRVLEGGAALEVGGRRLAAAAARFAGVRVEPLAGVTRRRRA